MDDREELVRELRLLRRRLADLESSEGRCRLLERELVKTRAILEAAIEQAPTGFVIADAPDLRIRIASLAGQVILGKEDDPNRDVPIEEHVRGWELLKPDGSIFPTEERPLERAVLTGEPTEGVEARVRRPDGAERWLSVNAAPVRGERGEIVAGIAVFVDVTRLKLLEAEHDRTLSFFAHDMKSPLIGAQAFIERAMGDRAGPLTDKQREYLTLARDLTARALAMSLDFLDMTRFGADQPPPDMEPTDLEPLLRSLAREFEERARGAGLGFRTDLRPPLPKVAADASRLSRVVANLLDNAVKYSGRGTVELRGRAEDGQAVVEVLDGGPGLSEADLTSLFQPFHRGEAGRGQEGTGLGLAAAKAIIAAHGGEITADNRPGGGAVFRISLPAMAQEAGAVSGGISAG